jgi:(p)ppGpp synthase/HD superfamily hydrolase
MDSILEEVRDFADKAHGTQQRKYASERYIAHPVRVMEMCSRHTSSLPILAAALLHDVLEDTDIDKKALHNFLRSVMNEEDAAQTMNLVVELTDVYVKSAYPRWNRRKRKAKEAGRISKTSPESQTVKYADIIDNCREIAEHDPDFAGVFLLECKMLLRKIPEGQPELYREATTAVEHSLRKVKR